MAMISKVLITSPSDRIAVVAEIYFDNYQYAELRQEDDVIVCELYPCPTNNGVWNINLNDLQQSLEMGKQKLTGRT